MAVRAGYKQTEAGIIPDDWEIIPLSDLSIGIGDGIHATPKYVDASDYYFINGNNLLSGQIIITENTACVSEEEYRNLQKPLGDNSVLMSINGTIGSLAFFRGEKVVLGKSAAYINVKSGLKKEYLYYILQSKAIKKYYEDELTGTTIRNLSLGSIRNTPMPLPPTLAEQEAIAVALSDADALIAALEALIAKKRQIKQGAMQELLTGKKRLPGFSGEWEEKAISDMTKISPKEISQGGDENYLEIGDVDIFNKTYDLSSKEKMSVPGSVRVPQGTLLISTVRPTRGAIVITREKMYVSSAFCCLIPETKYLFYLVSQEKFLSYLGENSTGGTYPTCRDEDILEYKSQVPALREEQTAIAEILSDMDAEIEMLAAKLSKARQVKQGMMSELLTGRVRLV